MWKVLSWDSFPYDVGEQKVYTDCSVFSLYDGVKRSTQEPVSIFSYQVPEAGCSRLDNAKETIRKLKTLKHPSVLAYLDCNEDRSAVRFVTGQVVPLLEFLGRSEENVGEEYLRWGLMTIAEAVEFLQKNGMRHNNIFHGSVFVDDQGSWRLGEVGYITNEVSSYPRKVLDSLTKYDSQECLSENADYWGLGILIWEVYNGELDHSVSLGDVRNIPIPLQPHFLRFTRSSSFDKGEISTFIKVCVENNTLHSTLRILENYHLKPDDFKTTVSEDLVTMLSKIPKNIILKRILKILKQVYQYDSEFGPYITPVMIKIIDHVTIDDFRNDVESFLLTLFSSNVRATRYILLTHLEKIVNNLKDDNIPVVLSYFSSGFLDLNPKIRGETVKGFVHLAPKLPLKLLKGENIRMLVHILHNDVESVIRTNATICLAKIAHHLKGDSGFKMVLGSLLEALRDSCPSVRCAAVQALAITRTLYTLEVIAGRVLPRLVCLTVDTDSNVRCNTFKTVKCLLSTIERSYESVPEVVADESTSSRAATNSGSAWSLAKLTLMFLKQVEGRMTSSAEATTTLSTVAATARDNEDGHERNKDGAKEYETVGEAVNETNWENTGWENVEFSSDIDKKLLKTTPIQAPDTPVVREQLVKKKRHGPLKLGVRTNKTD